MKKLTVVLLLILPLIRTWAQQEAINGRILIVAKSETAETLVNAFLPYITDTKTFDPQHLQIEDADVISSLLGLPASIKPIAFKPFAAQHSVVLPELRQRLNPILWTRANSIRIAETETIAKLRQAESRIAHTFELIYDGDVDAVVHAIKKSGIAETIEPRLRRTPQYVPNDSMLSQQYALFPQHGIDAIGAWDIVKADASQMIAVVDVGTDWDHPDLRGAIYINTGETGVDDDGYDKRANAIDDDGNGFIDDWHGWDFAGVTGIAPDNNPTAFASHGTHTGGIMAAAGDNVTGVAGVAYGAKLLPLKASDEGGSSIDFGFDAMIYAADMGALAVNNSWGGTTRSEIEQDIVNYVTAKNCVVVAASGNNGDSLDFYPASYKGAISVGATETDGTFWSSSNYGTKVDVSAPGSWVLSTVPSGSYSSLSGTSMASPHVAGAVALVRKKYPSYDPLQVAERIRATADFLEPGPEKKDLTGRGRLNVKRAVSDEIAYSARIEKVELFDESANHILEPGESGAIVISVRNYLAPLQNLKAHIRLLSGTAFVTTSTTLLDLGPANTLQVVENLKAAFGINASPSTPPNTRLVFKVTFFDPTVGYASDVDYFTVIVNPAYQDLNTNNLLVTIDSKGGIGFNDPPNNSEGSGFQWRHAPEIITPKGRSILWQAGLMAAIDDFHVVASAPSFIEGLADQDWKIVKPIRPVSPPTKEKAAQDLFTSYTDENDTAAAVGLHTDQHSFAFTSGLSANAVVLDYVLRKWPTRDGTQPNDATSIALFMDWDIGLSGANNRAFRDSDMMTGITDRIEPGYPVVGIKLISDIPSGAELQYYALDNDGSNGSVSTYGGYEDVEKWISMTEERLQAGPGDVSTIYGLRNVRLETLDSVELTFIIALATDVASLRQTIAETEREWKVTTSVRHSSLERTGMFVYPNPIRTFFKVYWLSEPTDLSTIEIHDALGRTVFQTNTPGNLFETADLGLAAGIYNLRISTAATVYSQQIVILP
jgi:serine protease